VRGDAIEARPQGAWEKLARRAWHQKGRLVAGVAVFLFLVAAGLLIQHHYQEARKLSNEQYRQTVMGAIMNLQVGQMLINAESALDPAVDPFRYFTSADSRVTAGGGGLNPVLKAIEDLEKAAASSPGRPDAYYQRARGLRLLGMEEEAGKALEDAIRSDGNFVPARVLLAILREKRGGGAPTNGEGKPQALDALGVEETWRLAYLATSERRWSDASEAYSRLMKMEADGHELHLGSSLEARLGRGYAFLEGKQYVQAIEDFASAAALWPNLVESALLKGKAYDLMGNTALAKATFEEAYRSAPFPDEVARVMAIIYGDSLRDFEKALGWADRVRDDRFRETTRAACLLLLGRFDEAAAAAKRALEKDPNDVPAIIHLGTALFHKRRIKDAAKLFENAIQLDPRDPLGYGRLGYTLFFRGMPEAAILQFRNALERNPKYLGARIGLTDSLSDMGRFDEALAEAQESFRMAPKSAVVAKDLASLLASFGEYQKAEKLFKEANDLDPPYSMTYAMWGDALSFQDKREEALRMYEKALALCSVPNGRTLPGREGALHGRIGQFHEREGRLEEALSGYCMALKDFPQSRLWQRKLPPLLLHVGESAKVGRMLDDLGDCLEALLDQDYPGLLQTLAWTRLRGDKKRDLAKAFELIQKAREQDAGADPDTESVLAELQFRSGQKEEAILTLEQALQMPKAERHLSEQLAAYRQEVLPDLVSYSSIDAALCSLTPAEGAQSKLFKDLSAVAKGDAGSRRVLYLEARMLEGKGHHSDATGKLRTLKDLDAKSPEPLLGLARNLRATGDLLAAERELRQTLERGVPITRQIWDLWTVVSLVDLSRPPADLIAEFPQQTPEGYGADIHWVLERLRDRDAIRINCGSCENRTVKGTAWGPDRFYTGGQAGSWYRGKIERADDDALFLNVRWFPEVQYSPAAYRIPLPRGTYRVILRFAEVYFRARGKRVFDVKLEGEEVLRGYEPLKGGFATADTRQYTVAVEDGILDIEFVRRVDNPMISAIEIERLGQ
jgi:tetratricopeptide (TPR) repeat protein